MARSMSKFNPDGFAKDQIKYYVFLIPFAIFMALPIVYIFSTAFKPIDELFAFPPRFLVHNPTLDNFKQLFGTSTAGLPMSRYLLNSLFVAIAVTGLSIILSSTAGYVLSKKEFRGRKFLFEMNKLSLMFVSVAVSIPSFLVISKIGIIDSYLAHILPMIVVPVGLFLVKQFVDDIPDELIEAARLDGAGDLHIYRTIVMPLIAPALVTVAILSFQASWNNTVTSNLYINSEELKTFAFYLSSISNASNSVAAAGVSAASSLIMFLPNMIIFIFLQSKVMDTMARSGIK